MKNVKACLAFILLISLLSLTACGAKTAETDVPENVVEIDFANRPNPVEAPSENASSQSESIVSSADNAVSEYYGDDESESGNVSAKSENKDESKTESSEDESKTESSPPRKPMTGVPVEDSWFDDCLFIGDSLTLGLSLYNDWMDEFGNADFVCSAGLGWVNAQWDLFDENEVHPMYYGEKILVEDAINVAGANKAIIGLGMNDIGTYGVDMAISGADELLSKIQEKSPGVRIYLVTVSPMIESAQYDRLNNTVIREYDDRLEVLAKEHGCGLINSWNALVDDKGNLPDYLCEDPGALGLHLNNEGCDILCEYIKCSVS